MSIKEFFVLLWINFVVMIRNIVEFFKIAFRYYGTLSFLKADVALRLMYLFHNPYKISKRFLMNRGAQDVYAYGETPLTSLELIVRQCTIRPSDCVFELGAGRGRTCFWLHSFIGCSVVGIEQVPEFIERANRIARRLKMQNIEFRHADMLETDYSGATVCYLYGTCLDEKEIRKLAKRFAKLPPGTKIITVSYPITDYTDNSCFEVMKRFVVPYTWGTADVYLQVVKSL
ncbi:MAG: class I SAM-dependent methyltransferase [Parachlamydiaceae bacterium]